MKITKFLLIAIIVFGLFLLTGCFNDKSSNPEDTSGEKLSETQVVVFDTIQETYGNGSSIVNYKGNIYYIEFGNNDYTYEALRIPEYYLIEDANTQRYVNMMDNRGNIKNLFKVSGCSSLNIVDDRFYLKASNGLLYTVDMNGDDAIELNRGEYVAFDEDNHVVYYQLTNKPNELKKFDTKTHTISTIKFNNPLTSSNYNFLNSRNGKFYYSLLDKRSKELVLIEYDLDEKNQTEVAKLSINLHESEYKDGVISDFVDCVTSLGKYTAICVGTPVEGSIGGFYDKEIYIFDLDSKTITKSNSTSSESDWYSSDDLYKSVFMALYEVNTDSRFPSVSGLINEDDKTEFAERYGIDLSDTLGAETVDSDIADEDEAKYIIEIEDYTVVGNTIFYKITASRRNPLSDVGWRASYVRMISEVYLKNLVTKETKFIYKYVNNNYSRIEDEIKEILAKKEAESGEKNASGDFSGEIFELIGNSGDASSEPIKVEQIPIDISTANIWKQEFDVRVEEVGGMIIGKRIEYEGHHTKDENLIRILVTREPGAMLTVYIDGEASSQMTIE